MMAMHKMQNGLSTIGGQTPAEKEKLRSEVQTFKEEAERVCGDPFDVTSGLITV
jgi:hypothetical protein